MPSRVSWGGAGGVATGGPAAPPGATAATGAGRDVASKSRRVSSTARACRSKSSFARAATPASIGVLAGRAAARAFSALSVVTRPSSSFFASSPRPLAKSSLARESDAPVSLRSTRPSTIGSAPAASAASRARSAASEPRQAPGERVVWSW